MAKLAFDTGGTFTDFALLDDEGHIHLHKVLSTPDNPARAVVAGVERGGVEIKTQTIWCDEGTLIGRVGIADLMQRPVKEVGRGVVHLDSSPPFHVNLQGDRGGVFVRTFFELQNRGFTNAEHIQHLDRFFSSDHHTGVADLASFIDVKRAAIHDRKRSRFTFEPA